MLVEVRCYHVEVEGVVALVVEFVENGEDTAIRRCLPVCGAYKAVASWLVSEHIGVSFAGVVGWSHCDGVRGRRLLAGGDSV